MDQTLSSLASIFTNMMELIFEDIMDGFKSSEDSTAAFVSCGESRNSFLSFI